MASSTFLILLAGFWFITAVHKLPFGTAHAQVPPSLVAAKNGSLILTTSSNASVIVNGVELQQLFATVDELKAFKSASLTAINSLEQLSTHALETISQMQALNCHMQTKSQALTTASAVDVLHFTMDDTPYLVLANDLNGTSSQINSEIFKWNHDTREFVSFQNISTKNALDWEHFVMAGIHYLVAANHYDDSISSYQINSLVFQWSSSSKQFEFFQTLPTNGAFEWKHFAINGVDHLVVANKFDSNSEVFQWSNALLKFISFQKIPTQSAIDVEFFAVDGNYYIVFANNYGGDDSYQVDSELFKWNSNTGKFLSIQKIPTLGAFDWQHFTIDDVHYLAVANFYDDHTLHTDSEIFRWDSQANQLFPVQKIATYGAVQWEHFVIDDVHYLAVLNLADFNEVNSKLFKWTSSVQQFVFVQNIPTKRAFGWDHFAIDNVHYLAIASQEDGTTGRPTARILVWNGCRF
eukprot:m.125576 g.125576  ORF g.125576 m.125576 type:complete len:465 (+) comp15623_c0_seq1:149-1543(+)